MHDPHRLLNPGEEAAAGSFGRINTIADLPGDDVLKAFVLQAIELNESGVKIAKPKIPAEKKELVVPDYFIHVLNENQKAREAFEKFSYSHKKEYLEWIIEAKTDATREKRIAQAMEMMSEGKSRNWKYQ